MKKIIQICIFLFFITILIGCSFEGGTTTNPKVTLETPKLSISDGKIVWEKIENATYYEIYLNGKKEKDTQKLFFDLFYLADGTYAVKVRACNNDTNYVKSQYASITYEKKTEEVDKNPEIDNPNNENDKGDGKYSVFMINDTHGAYCNNDSDPGFEKIASLLGDLEKEQGDIIKIANGDIFQGSYVSNVLYGKPIFEVMNYLEFDAFVLGNHDFDWGLDKVYTYYDGDLANGEANYPVLGANIYDKATNKRVEWIEPYTIVEVDGDQVGIIGIIGYELESSILAENVADYEFIYPVELIKQYAKELRQKGCDSVIVSIHDFDQDLNSEIAKLSGDAKIDGIFCGHTHQKKDNSVTRSDGVTIPVVQNYDKNGCAVNVEFDINSQTYKTSFYYPSNYQNNLEVLDLIKEYQDYIDKGNEIIGYANYKLNKSTLGKNATDAMQEAFEADIAIINTGGIRETISSGNITVSKVFDVFPFNNEIIIVELKGSAVMSLYQRNSSYLYFNTSFNINNIEQNKTYKIAVIDYVFTGVYYYEFKNVEYIDTNILLRDVFIEYIEENY